MMIVFVIIMIAFNLSFVSCGFIHNLTTSPSSQTPTGPFVLFLHPHKAGGTTLCRIFLAEKKIRIGQHQNCNPIVDGNIWNSIPLDLNLQSLAQLWRKNGHNFLASEYKPLPPSFQLSSSRYQYQPASKLWTLVTLLRHPIERIVSHFYFEHLRATYSSIINWADAAPYHTQNYYVRMFSGYFPTGASQDSRQRWTDYDKNEPVPRFWTNSIKMTDNDLLRAKQALKHFSVVLLLDRMEESIMLLRRVLGFEVSDFKKHENRRSAQKNITHEEHQSLLAINRLDMELFEYAHDLMDSRLKEMK